MKIARVLIESVASGLDSVFDYLIPDEFLDRISLGARVAVPFGIKKVIAFVWEFAEESEFDKLKSIIKIIDEPSLITENQLKLAAWMADYYFCSRVDVLRLFLPSGARLDVGGKARIKQKEILLYRWNASTEVKETAAGERVRAIILQNPQGLSKKQLMQQAEVGSAVLDRMVRDEHLAVFKSVVQRSPVEFNETVVPRKSELNQEQQIISAEILDSSVGTQFLLHGVTGSGKTEIYFDLAERVLDAGKQVLYLVPEISLAPQTLERARCRFGNRIALLHSNMSDGERYDQWFRVKQGTADFVLGARSALFAPLERLGLIIVDEEHENTYKQEEAPRYHVRETVQKLTELTGAKAIFGSATPSLETFYQAQQGKIHYLKLNHRYNQNPLPEVTLVDLREELKRGNRNVLSAPLQAAIAESLERREQIILLLNRRGHSTFVMCRDCGESMRCPVCDVSLTYHSQETSLRCHYCDYRQSVPNVCPKCGSLRIKYFGNGTQKLESELKTLFPEAGVVRMDVDSTTQKGAHQRIFKQMVNGDADILLGTQMIAKGLDLPRVGLVGVVAADSTLNLPDFRGAERAFHLLTQVAGRTGRGSSCGRVIFQTYNPEHYALQFAKLHDYEGFYNEEIENRRILAYPPFSELFKFGFSGIDRQAVVAATQSFRKLLTLVLEEHRAELGENRLEILGPSPALIEKVNNRYRHQIIIKSDLPELMCLIVRDAWQRFSFRQYSNVRIIRDRQPYSVM